MELTKHEESQLRTLTDAAFDAKGTPQFQSHIDAITAWYDGIYGRRLALRVVAGEQFLLKQEEGAR